MIPAKKDDRPFVHACCVCGRVKYQNKWIKVGPDAEEKFRLSHGYCDACFEAAMAALELRGVKNERERGDDNGIQDSVHHAGRHS